MSLSRGVVDDVLGKAGEVASAWGGEVRGQHDREPLFESQWPSWCGALGYDDPRAALGAAGQDLRAERAAVSVGLNAGVAGGQFQDVGDLAARSLTRPLEETWASRVCSATQAPAANPALALHMESERGAPRYVPRTCESAR